METKNLTLLLLSVFFVMPATINQAYAGDIQVENLEENQNTPLSVHRNDWALNALPVPITTTEGEPLIEEAGTARETLLSIEDPDFYKKKKDNPKYTSKFKDDRDFEDRILEKIPYGEDMKHAWNVIDGDVDLYFTGLRADRKNTGLSYTTSDVPFIGEVQGFELKFSAGEDNEVEFKTSLVPFMGELEGLTIKGATGDKGSRIFARYTVPLDF